MRLSFSPSARLFLFLVQWTDCYLAGALGLLRILVYMTYSDGKTTMSVHERKATLCQFYAIPESVDRLQKESCSSRYRKRDPRERCELTDLEKELEDERGICMEIKKKVVLPNCCHSLCFKCYLDWSARSHSCPFCRNALKQVKPGDLWIYTDDSDTVDLSIITKENVIRLFDYFDKLPLMDPNLSSVSCNSQTG